MSTNRPTSRGVTVKTHKASATTSGETESAFPKGNNRNCNKRNINNNNISSAAADVQRKRQHSPEKPSAHINGNITDSHCDISKSGKLLMSLLVRVFNGVYICMFIKLCYLTYFLRFSL